MMVLIVNGHPDKASFCSEIYKVYKENIDASSHDIAHLNLGELFFDPVLRYGYRTRMTVDPIIEESQKLIQWADHLVFIYPIWWSSMPSLLKGWIERVFTPGIAYSSNYSGFFLMNYIRGRQFKKLLSGRTADIIVTSMAPTFFYKIFSGPISVPDSYGISVLKNAVLSHCGIKTKKILVLGNMRRESNTIETRLKFLQAVEKRAKGL